MNTLSWFLYLAEVAGNLNWMISMLFITSIIGLFVTGLIFSWVREDLMHDEEERKIGNNLVKRLLKITVPLFFTTFILGALIPSEKTMYLIMGSEVSEEVIQSETGLKVQEAIQKKLDEYLDLEKVVTNERD